MSLGVCIPDLIAQGAVPPAKAARLQKVYDEFLADYGRDMALPAAEAQATEAALKWLRADVLAKARQHGLQARAQAGWLKDLRMKADAAGSKVARVKDVIERMARIDNRIDALRGRYFATLDGFLAKHRRNLLGQVRERGDLMDVGRALFGEQVADVNAREMADAIGEVMELARMRFNQAGGRIGRLENYGLPQHHDSRLVRGASFEEWRAHPAIDRARVLDIETGEMASGMRRETILRAAYEAITTDGANRMRPGQMFGGSMANRRGDPRVIHMAGFDDWMEYQARFGGSDTIYDIVTGHLGAMARDTALMEEMGPNPAATTRWLGDLIEQDIGLRGDEGQRGAALGQRRRIEAMYAELSGASKLPSNRRIALGFSMVRAVETSAKLGSAMLSVLPDFASTLWTAGFSKAPVMGWLPSYLKLWNPLDTADREMAVRLGLVTDDWIGLSSASHRYLGEELTGEVARRMADFTIRAQGLARHTRNLQWAFGMNFISALTHQRQRAWANLEPDLRAVMARHNIGEAQWDALRATPTRRERGADWLHPLDMADQRTGEAVMEMILAETDHAVVTKDVRVSSFVNDRAPTGDWFGESLRTGFLFKGFPMYFLSLHGRRMMQQSGLPGKLGYAVPLVLLMTAGGALSAQLKAIAAGKDPLPMGNAAFAGKALLQGGGLGLFGDLLYNSENSYGGGLGKTLLGPVIGQTIPDVLAATGGNVLKAARGEDTEFVADSLKVAESLTPGRSLWYARLALERLFFDQVEALADPDAARGRAALAKRAAKEGTSYFWQPGDPLPDRAPDLANAAADAPPP